MKWNKGTTASGYQLQQYKDGKWVTIYTEQRLPTQAILLKSSRQVHYYRFRIRAYKTYGNTTVRLVEQ
ncbi:MAG: hypothetical protein ACLS48_09480 [[Eubacterium] siraeum]